MTPTLRTGFDATVNERSIEQARADYRKLSPSLMDVTLVQWDAYSVGLEWPWSQSPLFEKVKDTVKAVPGHRWHPKQYVWTIPIDSLWGLSAILRAMGCRIVYDRDAPDSFAEEMARRKAALNAMADILFAEDVPDWTQPEGLTATLSPLQKVGVKALGNIYGGALEADPTGSGKTVMTIADMLARKAADAPGSVLFVAETSLKFNIQDELQMHMGLDEDDLARMVTVIDGTKAQRVAQWASPTPIKVAGYEATFIHDWEHVPKHPERVYADEVTKAKNPKTNVHRRLLRLQPNQGLVGMSATPYETKPDDVFHIMSTLRPGILGSMTSFKERYTVTDDFNRIEGYRNLDRFAEIIAPYVIRRPEDKMLAEVPAKTRRSIKFKLTKAEYAEYNEIADTFLSWARGRGMNINGANVLVQQLRMRQFLDSPALVGGKLACSKLELLAALLDERSNEKTIVFSQFETMVSLLHNHFGDSYTITGKVPAQRKLDLIKQFNGDSCPVLFATDSIARGQNITGATTVIHYDQLWNPAKMREQREGRVRRRGQTRETTALTLVAQDTIEEYIEDVLIGRAAGAESMWSGAEEVMLSRITTREWEQAVRGKVA